MSDDGPPFDVMKALHFRQDKVRSGAAPPHRIDGLEAADPPCLV